MVLYSLDLAPFLAQLPRCRMDTPLPTPRRRMTSTHPSLPVIRAVFPDPDTGRGMDVGWKSFAPPHRGKNSVWRSLEDHPRGPVSCGRIIAALQPSPCRISSTRGVFPRADSLSHRGWDDTIVERFRAGESDAIDSVTAFMRLLISRQRTFVIPRAVHEDVAQESFLRLQKRAIGMASFDRVITAEEFEANVHLVVHGTAVDWLRRAVSGQASRTTSIDEHADLHDGSSSPEEALLEKEHEQGRHALLRAVLSEVGEDCTSVLTLHAQGMTYEEIGRRMGRSPGALRVKAHQCLKRAREILTQHRSMKTPPTASSRG